MILIKIDSSGILTESFPCDKCQKIIQKYKIRKCMYLDHRKISLILGLGKK
jgi:deoxycytidylate deaminase